MSPCRAKPCRAHQAWCRRGAGRSSATRAATGWEGWDVLKALIPEAEMSDLIIELRSATSGVGGYCAKFDHLAEVVGKPADAVVAHAAQQRAMSGH